MKFLREFPDAATRDAVLASIDYGVLSYTTGVGISIKPEGSGPGPTPASDHYIGTINVEEEGSFKILAGGESGTWDWYPARVVVDGVELEELSGYIYLTQGLHTIEIWDDPENSGYYTMSYATGYFYSCQYSSMIIPDYITQIGNTAFYYNTTLASVNIPEHVTAINGATFESCGSLTSITIPSSVTIIEYNAFINCSSLTSITCNAIIPPTLQECSAAFDNTNDCPIYVPASSVNAYKAATGWSEYAERIQAIQS